MSVTVEQVRHELNDITIQEVSDNAIQRKIDDAVERATILGITDPTELDRFTRLWAAYRSFIISWSFTRVEQLNIQVQRDLKLIATALKQDAEDATEEIIGGEGTVTESTPMWDERPPDPYDPCEDDDCDCIC